MSHVNEPPNDRSPATPTRMPAIPVILGGTSISSAAAAWANAPWWAITLCTLGGVLCTVLHTVFPHESGNKLSWWKDLRRHRERLRNDAQGHGITYEPQDPTIAGHCTRRRRIRGAAPTRSCPPPRRRLQRIRDAWSQRGLAEGTRHPRPEVPADHDREQTDGRYKRGNHELDHTR